MTAQHSLPARAVEVQHHRLPSRGTSSTLRERQQPGGRHHRPERSSRQALCSHDIERPYPKGRRCPHSAYEAPTADSAPDDNPAPIRYFLPRDAAVGEPLPGSAIACDLGVTYRGSCKAGGRVRIASGRSCTIRGHSDEFSRGTTRPGRATASTRRGLSAYIRCPTATRQSGKRSWIPRRDAGSHLRTCHLH